MGALPLILTLDDKVAVVVGGGPVARRRATVLAEAGAAVTLIAPSLQPPESLLPPGIRRLARTYRGTEDLKGAFLVVIATSDRQVNDRIGREAQAAGLLVNRADAPEAGDVRFPARRSVGAVELSVHTGGASASAARQIAGELAATLAPHWPLLLECAARYRRQIQEHPVLAHAPDRRQVLLQSLTDSKALAMLVDHGIAALESHYWHLLQEALEPSPPDHRGRLQPRP